MIYLRPGICSVFVDPLRERYIKKGSSSEMCSLQNSFAKVLHLDHLPLR